MNRRCTQALAQDGRCRRDTLWARPDPAETLSRWNGDPVLWAVLTAATVAGLVLLRGPEKGRYAAVLAIGFISPLCALSSALFAARTLHHLLLVRAAEPLLALCLPRLKRPRLAAATAVQAVVFCPCLPCVSYWVSVR